MKISVIVPIYNMEKFISRAIQCLKIQDEQNIEFLLINDGSKDSTLSIMRELTAGDTRFQIFDMENKGYGHACNFGIKQATGEFFAIFEPDDSITSDFYSSLHKVAERYQQADVIRYNGIYCNENGLLRTLYRWEQNFTGKIIDKYTLKRFWRSHPSVFNGIYRKSFIQQKLVFFCETPSASFQDAMFIVSLFYANPSIFILDDIKYYYTIHEMQSVKFVDDKIDFVIESWKIEEKWLSKNGFADRNFFLYKVFVQMSSLMKKVSAENKYKLIQQFNNINKGKLYLASNIPTMIQKVKYALT